jgi:16S rRNA (guanine527-N7)-methyltransferase
MPDFAEAVRDLGLDLDATIVNRFRRYRDLIAEAAGRFSLTTVRESAAIERRHFLESLALGSILAERGLLADGARVIDVGSGAGLPGIPLKLAWPGLRLGLLESNAKRCAFLRDCVRELELEGVEVLEGRAEDFGQDLRHRAAYDLALARAVAPLPVLLEYALPYLRIGGRLAATKGSGAAREIDAAAAALEALGGSIDAALPFAPPGGIRQTLIIVNKDAPTPDRYSRRSGIPSKRPLA